MVLEELTGSDWETEHRSLTIEDWLAQSLPKRHLIARRICRQRPH